MDAVADDVAVVAAAVDGFTEVRGEVVEGVGVDVGFAPGVVVVGDVTDVVGVVVGAGTWT